MALVNGRPGFVFHEACWSLLEEASSPAPVPLRRLFDVCCSFSAGAGFLNWGHDYGGAIEARFSRVFPWEEEARFAETVHHHPRSLSRHCNKNPYRVPGVDGMLADAPEQPPAVVAATGTSGSGGGDCFTALPEELRAEIAMYLPTGDVLSARLASRAFWPIFYRQQFWASRFRGSSERSWLFEACRERRPRDWRWLYRRTGQTRKLPPGLQNRRRIWGLIQGLLNVLSLEWNELPAALPAAWSPDPILPSPGQGAEGSGCLGKQPRRLPRSGNPWQAEGLSAPSACQTLRSQRVAIPCDLARFSVSTVTVGRGCTLRDCRSQRPAGIPSG
jgi:hypothetical protein